jgi:hypothetical protein
MYTLPLLPYKYETKSTVQLYSRKHNMDKETGYTTEKPTMSNATSPSINIKMIMTQANHKLKETGRGTTLYRRSQSLGRKLTPP